MTGRFPQNSVIISCSLNYIAPRRLASSWENFLSKHILLILAVLAAGLLLLAGLSCESGVQRIELDIESDASYLPFFSVVETHWYALEGATPVVHSMRVVCQGKLGERDGSVVYAQNPNSVDFHPSRLLWKSLNTHTTLGEKPIPRISISDQAVVIDSQPADTAVIITGFWQDSAYVIRWSLSTDSLERLFVATGQDANGDSCWKGIFSHVVTADYDQDGRTESIFYLDSQRDLRPRLLVSVQSNPFKVEWTLPVASPVTEAYPCEDSLGPGLLVATHNPGQGAQDSLFRDDLSRLFRVNTEGKIVFHHLTSKYPNATRLVKSGYGSTFYMVHDLPLDTPEPIDTNLITMTHVSKINAAGQLLAQSRYTVPGSEVLLCDWQERGLENVYIRTRDNSVHILDSSLRELAVYSGSELPYFRTTIAGFAGESTVLPCDEPGLSAGIFDGSFRKLLDLPKFDYAEVAERDGEGNVSRLVVATFHGNAYQIGIRPREWTAMVAIFYRNNQLYILVTLFAALAGAIVSNYYRRKTKQNLSTIARQKEELEQTHQALKEAQLTIIAQEKYRQARDIAGGFAHEIRNALFPADSSLLKLHKMLDDRDIQADKAHNHLLHVGGSISRAIAITHLISQYTKLDSERKVQAVDLANSLRKAIAANRPLLDQFGIHVSTDGPEGVLVSNNETQLGMVWSNLILNSLDALTNRTSPTIFVSWKLSGNVIAVTFADNGIGISPDDLPRIFDTFFSTKPHKGTGLGLSTSKKIIEMYDGQISVTSEPGMGTTFEMRLKSADR